jgi:hypothetical protein
MIIGKYINPHYYKWWWVRMAEKEPKEKKKGRKERTALQKIQEGKTMFVAKLFFRRYLTPNIVTRIMYPIAWKQVSEKKGQGFVMPYIRDCLKEWKNEGFIEKSPIKLPFRVEKKKGKPYWLKNYGYRLTLEPIYRYCKERSNITFTKEEKVVLDKRIGLESMRGCIFREYPNDDMINATIKFYLKQFGIAPIEILDKKERKLLEFLEKVEEKESKELKEKAQNNKISDKKQHTPLTEGEFETMILKSLLEKFVNKETKKLKVPLSDLKNFAMITKLLLYIASYKKNPKLMSSINKKFKKVLGILA